MRKSSIVGIIEFEFLEVVRSEYYLDRAFYKLFQILIEFEKKITGAVGLPNYHLIVVNGTNLFIKEYGINEIKILKNRLFSGLVNENQYVIVCHENDNQNPMYMFFVEELYRNIRNLFVQYDVSFELLSKNATKNQVGEISIRRILEELVE